MPFKSKWNYKGKQLAETRTGEGLWAREQAVISLGPALEWNLKKELQLKLLHCYWTQTKSTVSSYWWSLPTQSSQESLFSEQQNCLPRAGKDSQSKIYQSFWPGSHVSAPSAASQLPIVLLLQVSVSHILHLAISVHFSFQVTPLLFEKKVF